MAENIAMEPPVFYWPDYPTSIGHASLLDEPKRADVLLWVPDPAEPSGWKSDKWIAKARQARPLGFWLNHA